MSFLRPDNNSQQNGAVADDNGQIVGQDQSQVDGSQVQTNQTDGVSSDSDTSQPFAPSGTPNGVTVTTSEGSTLHTFNDPSLNQPAPSDDHLQADNYDNTQIDSGMGGPESTPESPDFQPYNQSEVANDTFSGQPITDPNIDVSADENPSVGVDTSLYTSQPNLSTDAGSYLSVDETAQYPATSDSNPVDTSELDIIKTQALEQLRPLLEKVDLPATEKFDKYLMMLRATDDSTLIQPAFNAAQGITDDKDKAEALVDIINEINYVSNGNQAPGHTA